tara:strand:- start:69 stop:476 length:408 start_codon:yes stop_codon:yes gene_type:complete
MISLPKVKKCPCCKRINVVLINGITYENNFHSMADWVIKKLFNCRKCKVELGLFIHKTEKKEKIIWMDIFKCEDSYYDQLNKLHKIKEKNINNKKLYNTTLDDINKLYNKIRAEQVKIKIKVKIQSKGILIGHVY